MDSHQAAGLADAATFVDMFQHGEDFLLRQGRPEEHGPPTLGKPRLTGLAAEHPTAFVRPIVVAD
jgi:hypothetical protein